MRKGLLRKPRQRRIDENGHFNQEGILSQSPSGKRGIRFHRSIRMPRMLRKIPKVRKLEKNLRRIDGKNGVEVRDRATVEEDETIGFSEKRPLDALNLHE